MYLQMILRRLVSYPESSVFREEPWFKDESIPANDPWSIRRYGTEAYWIPLRRIEEFYTLEQ